MRGADTSTKGFTGLDAGQAFNCKTKAKVSLMLLVSLSVPISSHYI